MSDEQQQNQQQQQHSLGLSSQSQTDFDFWVSESVKDRTFNEDFDLGNEFTYQTYYLSTLSLRFLNISLIEIIYTFKKSGHFGRIYECRPKGTTVSMCLKVIPKNVK